jgi:hypothetical protein
MAIFTAIATGLSIVGATVLGTAATGTLLGAVVGGAMIGAVVGGVVAAVKGENILEGALTGGLWGAAAGGALGLASMWAGGMAGTEGAIALTQAPAAAVEAGVTAVPGEAGAAAISTQEGISGVGMTAVEGGTTVAPGAVPAATEVAKEGILAGMTAGDKIAGAGLILGTAGQLLEKDPIDASLERRKRFEVGEFQAPGAGFQWEDKFSTVDRFEKLNAQIDDNLYAPGAKYSAGWWKGKPATATATATQTQTGAAPSVKQSPSKPIAK